MPKGKEPTPKQKAFADEYLKCGNQTEAAKRAGYSEKTARQAGAENMKKPVVLEYIQKRQKQIEDARIADITEVMQYLTSVMRGEIKDQFDLEAPLSERTRCAQELLKRNMDDRRMNIELAKLEAQYKDSTPEEESTDNFLDVLMSLPKIPEQSVEIPCQSHLRKDFANTQTMDIPVHVRTLPAQCLSTHLPCQA